MKKTIALFVAIILCVTLCAPSFADNSWTIFVYLCGSNLESEYGLASQNMQEMIEGSAAANVRFVVETGGAASWSNEASAYELDRFEIAGGVSTVVERNSFGNMGDSGTLADFLRWGLARYSSAHTGLVLWNHGGGSISGVCFDELSGNDSLSLRKIDYALSSVRDLLPGKFDFIGFDACLMGTLETAAMLAPYANYMIGSQEIEPGSGWDFSEIGNCLAADPSADVITLGKAICDGYYENCVQNEDADSATLAMTDLSKIDALRTAFEIYAEHLYDATDDEATFAPVVRALHSAENFGSNNRSEGYTNMVDFGGLISAGSAWSDNAVSVLEALDDAVIYKVQGPAHKASSGLSVYYPLSIQGSMELGIFRDVCVSTHYLALVDKIAYGFANGGSLEGYRDNLSWNYDAMVADYSGQSTAITFLQEPAVDENGTYSFVLTEQGLHNTLSVDATVYMLSENEEDCLSIGYTSDVLADWDAGLIQDDFDGYWFSLPDGQNLSVCLVDENEDYSVYTSPVTVNGEETNLRFIWYYDPARIELIGLWDGIDENGIADRSGGSLNPGDCIVPRYESYDQETGEKSGYDYLGWDYIWEDGDNVLFDLLADGYYLYSFTINDIFGGSYVTDTVGFFMDEGNIEYSAA